MGNANNKQSSPPPLRRGPFHNIRRAFRGRRNGVRSSYHGALIPTMEHSGECPVCCESYEILLHYSSCSHLACALCWLTFICTELESFAMARLTCIGCKKLLPPATVINMLTQTISNPEAYGLGPPSLDTDQPDEDLSTLVGNCSRMLSRFDEFLLRRVLSSESDVRWCPGGCGYGLIAHGYAACPQIPCERAECNIGSFCYKCQRPWFADGGGGGKTTAETDKSNVHVCPPGEQQANDLVEGLWAMIGLRQMRRQSSVPPFTPTPVSPVPVIPEVGENNTDQLVRVQVDEGLSSPSTSLIHRASESGSYGEIKPCPKCGLLIEKKDDGGCNHMDCSMCGFNFCWLCLRETTFGHYLSFSGCTMWGRQRWSRRKRFMGLLIVMFCTPIVMPLLIGLGIPIMWIAMIPLSISAILDHTKNSSKLRKVLLCSLFVVFAIVIGPILGVILAVLLLLGSIGFVYIYLPIRVFGSFSKNSDSPLAQFESPISDA